VATHRHPRPSPLAVRRLVVVAAVVAVLGGGGFVAVVRSGGAAGAGSPRGVAPAGRPEVDPPGAGEAAPSASPSASAAPAPSASSGAFAASPPPQPGVGPLPAVPRGRTLAGASTQVRAGETYAQAVARADRSYGPLEMVRVFYPGLPAAWGGSRADVAGGPGRRTTVVSFKAHPREVLAGRHDAVLSAWFAGAPRDRDVYWVYYHEPEDDIAKGAFTAAEYRAAWRRIAALGSSSGGPRMYPTLVLMCFSVNPVSGRDWRDYYPGSDVVAALGWDCYNQDARRGGYAAPAAMFARSIEVSRSVGKPFGYAEMGSSLVGGDSGAGRAAWLRAVGAHLLREGPLWMAYWDSQTSEDYRLLDAPSQQAWSALCGRR
jgi:hypothetical protein